MGARKERGGGRARCRPRGHPAPTHHPRLLRRQLPQAPIPPLVRPPVVGVPVLVHHPQHPQAAILAPPLPQLTRHLLQHPRRRQPAAVPVIQQPVHVRRPPHPLGHRPRTPHETLLHLVAPP